MLSIKNIKAGNLSKFLINLIIGFLIFEVAYAQSENNMVGSTTDIKILDKISSKNELIKLTNGEELIYKDLAINIMKAKMVKDG